MTDGYDTPERVADVFGNSQAVQLPAGTAASRQGGSPLANLQQVLGASGITLRGHNDDDEDMSDSDQSGEQNGTADAPEDGMSRQDVSCNAGSSVLG
jgi:hypothetical protein